MAGTDLISRADAIDALRVAYFDKDIQSAKDDPCIVDAMTDWAIRQVKDLPSAERVGHWIDGEDVPNRNPYLHILGIKFCSECLNEAYWDTDYGQQLFDFCPYCGARMEGEKE